jgi:hypothetical protein
LLGDDVSASPAAGVVDLPLFPNGDLRRLVAGFESFDAAALFALDDAFEEDVPGANGPLSGADDFCVGDCEPVFELAFDSLAAFCDGVLGVRFERSMPVDGCASAIDAAIDSAEANTAPDIVGRVAGMKSSSWQWRIVCENEARLCAASPHTERSSIVRSSP